MENILQNMKLQHVKNLLYSLLALLIIICGVAIYQLLQPAPDSSQVAWCGVTESGQGNIDIIGKELFTANCASCHAKSMMDNLTGPALRGVTKRWAAYPEADLMEFIRHSQKMIRQKHPQALKVWKKFQPVIMNDFPRLTDDEIRHLLAYIEGK